jgi:hypothetical protein
MTRRAKPRRRIELKLTIGADNWDALRGALKSIQTEVAIHGRLSTSGVSGGYDSGWVYECSERPEITHDSWAADLNNYLACSSTDDR